MKKGFKFKLEALLKIRKLKEEQCKLEIGRIQVLIKRWRSEIDYHNQGIDQAYEAQERGLESGVSGQEARFHPFFVEGKRAHISRIEKEIELLQEQVDQKYEELKQFRADVKVLDEMKEKDKTKYKKDLQKRIYEEIEEQNQNWRQLVGGK